MSGLASSSRAQPWSGLYRTGAWCSLLIVALIPVQVFFFFVWPPPATTEGWFELFQNNGLLGLISMDLLYLLTNLLLIPLYLAVHQALHGESPSAMLLAVVLGLAGVVAYTASNPCFEMLGLSHEYARASAEPERIVLLAAGKTMLATYTGTAFNVYYVLNGVFLIITGVVMLRGQVFSRATGGWGLASGVLMAVPSTAGVVGPVFALASLLPWIVFSVLVARRLFHLTSLKAASQPTAESRLLA